MEYPCPSLDNIPLPDETQPRLRDRKKPTVCPAVSPGTSNTHISTDGQLTPFNMADVPLPGTKYNALSIPLPEDNNSSSSSKTLVDKLFEDFLSQKIKQPERSTKAQSSSKPAFTNSVEEIKRFLDKEINQLSCKAGFAEAAGASGIGADSTDAKNQLSCKAGFAEAEGASGIGADSTDAKNQIAAERECVREESTGAENASTVVNQRTPATLPLKIKISDSSVARISSGHLGPPNCNQSQSDELVGEVPVVEVPVVEEEGQPIILPTFSVYLTDELVGKVPVVEVPVVEEEGQPTAKAVCSENETEAKTDPIAPETDPEAHGVADVEAKSSKSSKKHKHKKKKSHKHSKDKNKSTPKLRLHSKKHKSVTKSHSKPKHKSSNGTKSPKKTSKTSHSKSKSSKKSKKTKTKTKSKSKQLAESAETESKSNKKSRTRSASPENQSTEDPVFGKASALSQILDENLALKSLKKEEKLPALTINSDRKSRSQSRSKSPECSPARKITTPKCHPEDNLVQKDMSSSPFQAKTLPLKVFSSPPPSPTNLTSHTPVTTSMALVTPVTASSVLQAITVSAMSHIAPPLQSQPHSTSSAELPAVSHSLESLTQSASVPLSTVPTTTCSRPDLLMQTSPVVSPALVSPLVSKQSPPLSLSSPLNQSSILSPAKSLLPVQELGGPVSHVTASLGTPPSLGMLNKSQEKDTLLNCSQTSLQTGMLVPSTSVSADMAKNSCMSSPTEPSEQANKVGSSLKFLNKNSTAGQSGLLGLAAYFKSKAQSPFPESTKDGKPAKKRKKTKCFSDSSDESSAQKRSRSTSRKSSHSRSLSRSGIGKHSSLDKRKKTRPRSRKSRSWSRSRSHSRSCSKSKRRPSLKSTKKRSHSRSRSRSDERGRQTSFRSSKRCFSRSPSRSRNKTYGRSRSHSRSCGRNRVTGHGASRSRSPSKRATYRRTRSRSRSYSRGRYRHHVSSRSNKSKSRSRSRSRSNIRSRDKRSRSRSSGHHRDYRQSNNKFQRFSRRRSSPRSRSSSASSSHSRRRRSRSKSDNSLGIDKVKLHDIAVKKLLESGRAPKEEVASLRAGGKTVQGLIDYCKRISQKELESDSGDSTQATLKSDDEEGSPFIHHPFKLRESQPNIVLNIKNAKPLPVLTPQEKLVQSSTLRLQFPVSSGSQHRAKESQWVPVQKNSATATLVAAEESASSSTGSNLPDPAATAVVVAAAAAYTTDDGLPSEASDPVSQPMVAETDLAAPGLHLQTIENKSNVDNVFPDTPQQNVDISQVMTERMLAVQKLQENPNDVQALNVMYKAQQEVNRWAQSKQLPGQFTGSTGAKVMTQEELNGPDKRFQAWAKKEQLQNAAPVRGGIGMHLLQKMGWRQGEGLGKHNEGPTEPILVNVKVDRKGLTSHGEDPKKSLAVEVAGKHPVSALVELCSKCKWGTPMFQQVEEKGPDHKKSFMFKVTVNNITYQPTMPSNSKKNGRARAAILCLQDLGLLPKNFVI